MGQFSYVLLTIDKANTVSQRVLDCRPGLGGLNQVYGPNHPTPSVRGISGTYTNIFTRRTHMNQHDIPNDSCCLC